MPARRQVRRFAHFKVRLRARAAWNWLRGFKASPVLRCKVCGHTVYPGRLCPNVANDGTHAIDGDGWPE